MKRVYDKFSEAFDKISIQILIVLLYLPVGLYRLITKQTAEGTSMAIRNSVVKFRKRIGRDV